MCMESSKRPRQRPVLPTLQCSVPAYPLPGPTLHQSMPACRLPTRSSQPEIFTFDVQPEPQVRRAPTANRSKRPRRVLFPAKVRRYLPPTETDRAMRWLYTLCLVVLAQICCEEPLVEAPEPLLIALPTLSALQIENTTNEHLPASLNALPDMPEALTENTGYEEDAVSSDLPAVTWMNLTSVTDTMNKYLPEASYLGNITLMMDTIKSYLPAATLSLGNTSAIMGTVEDYLPTAPLNVIMDLIKDFLAAMTSTNNLSQFSNLTSKYLHAATPPTATLTRTMPVAESPVNVTCHIMLAMFSFMD
ncbi:radiation-inducible immediate-early gene IEX-1 [Bombina bombina]|uniref:radiation-inducible immediate-early gene IEX-1 n=1 Tax=Bombina bombina TaxID=8345 RepID=UPI00235B1450|nr:radiation-inducible immediate-early gene IEX-1 [Bombina bombina]